MDNGTFWDVDPEEKEKWNNLSYADDTGLCRLNVSAVDVSTWGKAGAFAVIGGTTTVSRTFQKPTAEFFFSGAFKLFDDIQLTSKTQITAYYFYYENDEVISAGELEQWRQDTDSDEYTIDYTENPLSVELDAYRSGETYTLVILFEAYIEATGGSGTCYVDAFNATIGRQITVDKIRLYDACEWGADLEVLDYSLDWSEVRPGSMHNGSIRLRNAGTHCSHLDWEVIAWPDWGTWTFEPVVGFNLTPAIGPIMINVSVQAPSQEDQSFSGEICIQNSNDANDSEILPVRLTTPIQSTAKPDMPFLRAMLRQIFDTIIFPHFHWGEPHLKKTI